MFQCFDGSLNAYLAKYLKIIPLFDDFTVHHVSRDKNTVANNLAQQAYCFQSNRGKFQFSGKTGCSGLPNRIVYSVEPSSAKLDGLGLKPEGLEFLVFWMNQAK
jgi:hypothetical protein